VTTARQIITGALRFGLNRLSPGEAVDADLADVCLEALNSIADEMNGGKSMLWRQDLTQSISHSGNTATIGVAWTTLDKGVQILGASYYDGSQDIMISPITMEQYHAIPTKGESGDPQVWAYDGDRYVYFWPAPVSRLIRLHTYTPVSDFADLDTEYVMPKGYKSAFQAMLAKKIAPSVLGEVPGPVERDARAAKLRLMSGIEPAIIGPVPVRHNILTGG
jgi:hypothetical protein